VAQWLLLPSIAASASAIVVVGLAYLVAPSRKLKVARVFFAIGAAVTCFYSILLGLAGLWPILIAGIATLATGAATLIYLYKTQDRSKTRTVAHDA
jgi:Ca2+/Na+ antiporter